MSNKSKGKRGEAIAMAHYESLGFEILEQNYRFQRAEIDLIAHKDSLLVFIEVKLRSRIDFGEPESFVTSAQEDRIRQAAEDYIFAINWKRNIRFDIACIYSSLQTVIFEDAF